MEIELVAWLFSLSVATADNVWTPSTVVAVFHDMEYDEPDKFTVPLKATPSSWNCTLAIPWLDVAFAATNTVRVIVALLAGEVKDTVGKVACARATLRPQKAAETAKKHNELKKVWRKGRSHERYYCGLVILDKITHDVNEKTPRHHVLGVLRLKDEPEQSPHLEIDAFPRSLFLALTRIESLKSIYSPL